MWQKQSNVCLNSFHIISPVYLCGTFTINSGFTTSQRFSPPDSQMTRRRSTTTGQLTLFRPSWRQKLYPWVPESTGTVPSQILNEIWEVSIPKFYQQNVKKVWYQYIFLYLLSDFLICKSHPNFPISQINHCVTLPVASEVLQNIKFWSWLCWGSKVDT